MSADLRTTNVLLGIMATASVLEALVFVGAGLALFLICRKMLALIERGAGIIDGIETRQLAPAMTRVNAILDDVKDVTTRVKDDTERVDRAIHTTIDRIDDTAGRVSGMIRGARAIVEAVLRAA
jgi:hypothetical protein